MSDWQTLPHRRFNPLTGDWVLVSPHRLDRPWQGETVQPQSAQRPQYDPECYLCPGNARANGEKNPAYEHTLVFDNDYSALIPDVPAANTNEDDVLVAQSEAGRCRVVCFSPRHDLDIAKMDLQAIRNVVDVWAGQYVELGALPYVNAVTIFENRGSMMGASNPHPHGQIWANASIPNELRKETESLDTHAYEHEACLLCDYVKLEMRQGERVIHADERICAVVPFWAVWPFEALIVPRRHVESIDTLDDAERDALATAMQQLTSRYDRLFSAPFPYSMGVHQRPVDGGAYEFWHMHAHYYPPLLRSASVRKYLVGYEMLGQPQRDIAPEEAARRLRET